MIAFSSVSKFQVRLPAGDDQHHYLIYFIFEIYEIVLQNIIYHLLLLYQIQQK